MSWVSRLVEERLANAAAAGELDVPTLQGKPLDLDHSRGDGWWADQFVRGELSHDRRKLAEAAVSVARVGFWKAETAEQLADLVAEANRMIVAANINLIEDDRLDTFEVVEVERRWTELRSPG